MLYPAMQCNAQNTWNTQRLSQPGIPSFRSSLTTVAEPFSLERDKSYPSSHSPSQPIDRPPAMKRQYKNTSTRQLRIPFLSVSLGSMTWRKNDGVVRLRLLSEGSHVIFHARDWILRTTNREPWWLLPLASQRTRMAIALDAGSFFFQAETPCDVNFKPASST